MSKPKVIIVNTVLGSQIIAVDNIARVEPWGGGGSKIILMEVKDGSNVELLTSTSPGNVLQLMTAASAD